MEKVKLVKDFISELKERALRIVEQNRALITRVKSRGFNPVTELDFTANNAGLLIRKFFEAVAQFDEGKVPYEELEELLLTTDSLIDELKKCDNAPVCELDAVGVAFRKAAILWKDNHPKPLMRRKTYLKKHFEAEENIKNKLTALHAAYVKEYAAKGKKTKTLSAADAIKEESKENENRNRVYQEIDRLRKDGYSVIKAIESMRNGTYGSRMKDVSAETWKRYYLERSRRIRLEAKAKKTVRLQKHTIQKSITSPSEDEALNIITFSPGVSGCQLATSLGVGRSTLMRILAKLKEAGRIIYRGSKKVGGYYVIENEAEKGEENSTSNAQNEQNCGIIRGMGKSTKSAIAITLAIAGAIVSPFSSNASALELKKVSRSFCNPTRIELRGRVVKVADSDTIAIFAAVKMGAVVIPGLLETIRKATSEWREYGKGKKVGVKVRK